ncbi:MAG: hypothetical protein KKA81_14065 [Bacteroidetes bacterium]|nr:hypothetical protein [Bacteroidota bacterium]
MKLTSILSILTLSFILGACSSSYQSSLPYDDVYYSSTDKSKDQVNKEQISATSETREVYQSGTRGEEDNFSKYPPEYSGDEAYNDADYYLEEEEFEMDDYYDYSYSSRIRRFHDPNAGLGYYDNYYTNNYYYNYDPYAYGTSIYMGYNYYDPFYYSPSLYFGYSWGWGSIGWGWGYPYYDPWYCCGPYYPYYGGYWAGYWNGYWDGYYDNYYYNSYDYNSSYYGQRGSRGLNTNGTGTKSGRTFGEKYEDAVARGSRADNSTISSQNAAAKVSGQEGTVSPRTARESINTSKPATGEAVTETAARQYRTPTGEVNTTSEREARTSPAEGKRYEKPNTSSREPAARTQPIQSEKARYSNREVYSNREKQYSKPQTYSTPEYRNARSSQEYSAPRSPATNEARTRGSVTGNNNYSRPSGTTNRSGVSTQQRTPTQRYSAPSGNNSSRSYSAPATRTPSRTISTPSPSRSSISSPSRSSGSSGSSGSSRSSGGSTGGSRGGRR